MSLTIRNGNTVKFSGNLIFPDNFTVSTPGGSTVFPFLTVPKTTVTLLINLVIDTATGASPALGMQFYTLNPQAKWALWQQLGVGAIGVRPASQFRQMVFGSYTATLADSSGEPATAECPSPANQGGYEFDTKTAGSWNTLYLSLPKLPADCLVAFLTNTNTTTLSGSFYGSYTTKTVGVA